MVETKTCNRCKQTKAVTYFSSCSHNKSGYRNPCKECNNAYYRQRRIDKWEIVRSYEKKFHFQRRLKSEYGITEEYYNELKVTQNNTCAICEDPTKSLVIDHCHTTNVVRGLLCTNCNTGLGQFRDNPTLLQEAIKYLEKYK